ncbi:MAG: hypothetical protein CM1200mP2_05570 [Planctomycetaceae bacterium]|nr:MAG: hypothetical protein CM1200mP2_05570 [Planctomycetaceae bacterium]
MSASATTWLGPGRIQPDHQLSHNTKNPGGWKNFGVYCRFISEELGRFINKLKTTPEPAGKGNMLDNTLVLFGSASSAFHLSRNYPFILARWKEHGVQARPVLNYAGDNPAGGPWKAERPWQKESLTRTSPVESLCHHAETSGRKGPTGSLTAPER